MNQQTDNIRIELMVVACTGFPNTVYMQGQLEIYINQKKPYDDASDMINFENLLNSLKSDGEYNIFSCCCGAPECSGWNRGINVTTTESAIQWTNENTQDTWTFEKGSIREQLKRIHEEAVFCQNFFKEKGIQYVGVGYNQGII